jgi:hypothetical protein
MWCTAFELRTPEAKSPRPRPPLAWTSHILSTLVRIEQQLNRLAISREDSAWSNAATSYSHIDIAQAAESMSYLPEMG